MKFTERDYWVGVNAFFGFAPGVFKLLVQTFGSAKALWEASSGALTQVGVTAEKAAKFIRFRQTFSIEKYWEKLKTLHVEIVTLLDSYYPPLLKATADAPYVLYTRSKLNVRTVLNSFCIAVVGSRTPTLYGQEVTRTIVSELAESGVTIVSGLAYGVDVIAHRASMSVGGLTIAVLGSGVDICYPAQHIGVSREIVEKGALVSEFPIGMRPERYYFPLRNRIIVGLSHGIVVPEAAQKSGSLITASYAANFGRDVFAVPGNITSQRSVGANFLLKNGAKVVMGVFDILEEYPDLVVAKKKTDKSRTLSDEELKIMEIIKNGADTLDELAKMSDIPPSQISAVLSVLEIKGMVVQENGVVMVKM